MTRNRLGATILLGGLLILAGLALLVTSGLGRDVSSDREFLVPSRTEAGFAPSPALRTARGDGSLLRVTQPSATRPSSSTGVRRQRLTVRALEARSELPVEGATVEVLAPGRPRNLPAASVVTNEAGVGTVEFEVPVPEPHEEYRVRVSHPTMLALGYPASFPEVPGQLTVRLATSVRIEGRALDPEGWPLSGVEVVLGYESRTGRLETEPLATTDEAGAFTIARVRDLAPAPHLFALHPEYPPAYVPLDLAELGSSGATSAELRFEAGADLSLEVVDVDGRPVPDCRVGLVTARHPLVDYGTTFIGFPRHRSGVKGLRGVTDADGVFESAGWPVGEDVRVLVYDEAEEVRTIASVRPGRAGEKHEAIAEVEGRRASIVLTVERAPKVEVRCRGTAAGFSPEDRRALSLVLEDERGGRWGGDVDWHADSEFQVTFRIEPTQLRSDAKYHVFDRTAGEDARFGPYAFDGPTELGSMLLRR